MLFVGSIHLRQNLPSVKAHGVAIEAGVLHSHRAIASRAEVQAAATFSGRVRLESAIAYIGIIEERQRPACPCALFPALVEIADPVDRILDKPAAIKPRRRPRARHHRPADAVLVASKLHARERALARAAARAAVEEDGPAEVLGLGCEGRGAEQRVGGQPRAGHLRAQQAQALQSYPRARNEAEVAHRGRRLDDGGGRRWEPLGCRPALTVGELDAVGPVKDVLLAQVVGTSSLEAERTLTRATLRRPEAEDRVEFVAVLDDPPVTAWGEAAACDVLS